MTTITNYLYFASNAKYPYHKLSNFAKVEIEYYGFVYPSVEHAFQAQRFIPEDRVRFTIEGDLGSEEGFHLLFGKNGTKKKDYWMKKMNIGIIAKMSITHAKKLNLRLLSDFQWSDEKWIELLQIKFRNPEFRTILQRTNDLTLIEFSRSADNSSFWSGKVVDGVLIGQNMMGKYLMTVRSMIL